MMLTELSGNEIYCLSQKNYHPGNFIISNSIHSLGLQKSIESHAKGLLGRELSSISRMLFDGRKLVLERLTSAQKSHGIIRVMNKLVFHPGMLEFFSSGVLIHSPDSSFFSTTANGQELYLQLDMGYQPISFVFGNVAYSTSISTGIISKLKIPHSGEVKKLSMIFNQTRQLAFERILQQAKEKNANSVIHIKHDTFKHTGVNEMLLTGTASFNSQLPKSEGIITSHLSSAELWNLTKLDYAPKQLLFGTAVFSVGAINRVKAFFQSFMRQEIPELTETILNARKTVLAILEKKAAAIGAENVVGVKMTFYHLGNGLIEVLAIGTAIQKVPGLKTESAQLIPQAIIESR